MDSTRNPNLRSPLNESVSGGQAPPTFSPYFMNALFLGEHAIDGHCVIPFRAVFHISLTGKYKGCSSISLYSKKKERKRNKKKKKQKSLFSFVFPENHRLTDGCDLLPTTDLQKGRLFFNRKNICDINIFYFVYVTHFFSFLFCQNQKRLL